jgi:hypothetical protein
LVGTARCAVRGRRSACDERIREQRLLTLTLSSPEEEREEYRA